MDGRRIAASPRPGSGRRVMAKKRCRGGGSGGFINSVKKLQRREISSKRDGAFCNSNAKERFRNMRLQEEYDTHDTKGDIDLVLPFLRRRSKVIEIVAAHDIVFALAQSGLGAAFNRETGKRVCFVNAVPYEAIRSLFYNTSNDSLLTVSVNASDDFSCLKCRSTRIEYIRRGRPDAGFSLFESDLLKWPGFIEFDDVNGKVLTYSALNSVYKVYDLKNYTLLYSVTDENVEEVKISPGILLLISNQASSHIHMKILSIEDGTVLKSVKHCITRNKPVDFIEQFNEKLLIKQEDENLQILDVRNSELTEVSRSDFVTPSAFIFLYDNQLLLTFIDRTVAVWNFHGQLVTSFEDHVLKHPDCTTNNIHITNDQDLIISYCKEKDSDDDPGNTAGSINISNVLTGRCLAKIQANDTDSVSTSSSSDDDCLCSNGKNCGGKKCKSGRKSKTGKLLCTDAEALLGITSIYYDEDRNEIYTGNVLGLVHVWSN